MPTFPAFNAGHSDTVYVFVTFLLMLWFFKATLRFYRTFRIRDAFLSTHLVHIPGLGAYLSYFDGATRAHIHAIEHTRQAMPPEEMKLLYVPFQCHRIHLLMSVATDGIFCKLQFSTPQPSAVFLLINFKLSNWKRLLQRKAAKDGQWQAIFQEAPRGQQMVNIAALGDVCDKEILMQDIPAGTTTISLPLFAHKRPAVTHDQLRVLLRDLHLCAVLVPRTAEDVPVSIKTCRSPPKDPVEVSAAVREEGTGAAAARDETAGAGGGNRLMGRFMRQKHDAHTPAGVRSYAQLEDTSSVVPTAGNTTVVQLAPLSAPAPAPLSPTASTPSNVTSTPSCSGMLYAFTVSPEIYETLLPPSITPSTADSGTKASRMAEMSVDSFAIHPSGAMYNTAEVYGLSPSSTPLGPQGGMFTREECVVCLTEPKCVVLIPCRHLCVCSSCLIFVDKCPVCRAFFQEYVVIQCPTAGTPGQPAHAAGGALSNVVGGTGAEENV